MKKKSPIWAFREPEFPPGKGWSYLVWLGLGVAILISSYLLLVSWHGGGIAGCGVASGCDVVLKSRWAYWLGIPVSLLALCTYASLLLCTRFLRNQPAPPQARRVWVTTLGLSGLVVAAAVWFIVLQVAIIHRICPFCMIAHGCGLSAALILIFAAPIRPALEKDWQQAKQVSVPPRQAVQAAMCALLLATLLVTGQLFHTPPTYVVKSLSTSPLKKDTNQAHIAQTQETHLIPPDSNANSVIIPIIPSSNTRTNSTTDVRLFSLHEGQFQFKLGELPMLGPTNAAHYILTLFDYTCQHCRAVHHILRQTHETLGDQLGILMLPMPLDTNCNPLVQRQNSQHINACQYAKLGLALWRCGRAPYEEYDRWFFTNSPQPTPEQARQHAAQLAGMENLERQLNSPWIQEQLNRSFSLYYTNFLKLGDSILPEVMIGNKVTFGEIPSTNDFQRLLEEHLGIRYKQDATGVLPPPQTPRSR